MRVCMCVLLDHDAQIFLLLFDFILDLYVNGLDFFDRVLLEQSVYI